MPYHCCWGKCHSNSLRTSSEIHFLPFPKPWIDLGRTKRWVHLCGREGFTVDSVTKNTYICSLHFNASAEPSLDWKKNPSLEPVSARAGKEVSRRRVLERTSAEASAANTEEDLILFKTNNPKTYTKTRKTPPFFYIPIKPRNPPSTAAIDVLPEEEDPGYPEEESGLVSDLPAFRTDDQDEDLGQESGGNLNNNTLSSCDSQQREREERRDQEQPAEKLKSQQPYKNKRREKEATDLENEMLIMDNRILQQENDLLKDQNEFLKEEKSILTEKLETARADVRRLKQELEKIRSVRKIEDFLRILRSDSERFTFFTGITVDVFKIILSLLGPSVNELHLWSGQREATQRSIRFSPECQFLLTLIRLRQGVSIQYLAYQFEIGYDLLRRLFITWIQLLYKKFDESLRPHMMAPRTRHHPLPAAFRNSLLNRTRIVLDCTEVRTETSRDYNQQGNLYSNYKSHSTAKILIGCAPNGACMFVSAAHEGSISDKAIVEKSGVLDDIVEGDQVIYFSDKI